MKSYKDLEIYELAYQQAIEIHDLSLTLPKFELYEQGSQIRRSSKSVKDNIAEGYGRKRYKDDFIKYLTYAQASCDEVTAQLNMISDLYFKEKPLTELMENYDILGKKINKFIQYVEKSWNKKPVTSNKKQVTE
jgi:four helix bundle protein